MFEPSTTRRGALGLAGVAAAALAGCTAAPGGHGDAAATLDAESEEFVVVTDDETVESHVFTLHNGRAGALTVDASAWRVEREADDGWTEVAAGDGDGEALTVPPDGRHEWSLSLSPHPTPRTDDTTFVTAALEEGRHAFLVDGEDGATWRAEFDLVKREGSPGTA